MNVKEINIWKNNAVKEEKKHVYNEDIDVLNLSTRAFNALKRSGCSSMSELSVLMENNHAELDKVRNLGEKSIQEIVEKYDNYISTTPKKKEEKKKLVEPAKSIWDVDIHKFRISPSSMIELTRCGVHKVGDLYSNQVKESPKWFAVRELFNAILNY